MQFFKLFLLVMPILATAACGIRPKDLSPPSEGTAQEQVFPRQYPDPALYD